MWLLRVCWVLLATLGAGSAQLLFEKVTSVLIENGNSSVIIPCIITNLQLNNIRQMYVKWKLGRNTVFAFDGFPQPWEISKNSAFQSAELVDVSKLPTGVASISLSRKEAIPGNYSCEVTESNREGTTTVELKKKERAEIQEEQHAAPNIKTRKLLLSLRDEVRQINSHLRAVEQRLDRLERAG